MAAQNKLLAGVRPNGVEDAPQFKLDIDREKAAALGVPLADINQTLSTAWGATYVNDFLDRGRVKRVYVQGEAFARMQPQDLGKWHVRNSAGEMVPFSAFATGHWTQGAQKLVRYNGVPALSLQGQAAPGFSSGDAMRAMEDLVKQAARRASASSGRAFRTRSGWQAARLPRCTPSRWPWCSCAWPRCTKAGRFRPWCCWWCRWACWAR